MDAEKNDVHFLIKLPKHKSDIIRDLALCRGQKVGSRKKMVPACSVSKLIREMIDIGIERTINEGIME